MTETSVLISNESGILKLILNRPDKKNALTHEMYNTLANAFSEANQDASVKAIYLTGSQDVFTAGNDINDFATQPPSNAASPVIRFLHSLADLEKPLIVAANGPAVGIGSTLLLHSDFVVLGRETTLQMPFVSLGLCPEAASSYLLPLRVGPAKAAEWLLLGKRFTAEDALVQGLVNEVHPATEYQTKALQIAEQITLLPAASIKLSKNLLKRPHQAAIKEVINHECELFFKRMNSPEAKEAFSAFLNKRTADFSQFD